MTLRRRFVVAVASGTSVLCLLALVALFISPRPPLYEPFAFSTAITDREGRLLRLSLARDQRYRLFVPLANISDHAIHATLTYEDQHFYHHPGVNPVALIRAAFKTYVQRQRLIGGSTITMQLARLRFGLETRSIPGKLIQMGRALQLERHYTKEQILEAYLNLAPYGGNIEGIGTAALVYFDRRASDLSLPEASALAVIPQNPANRNPATPSGYASTIEARERLLESWQKRTAIDPDTLRFLALPLTVRTPSHLPFYAPHFSQNLLGSANLQPGVIPTTLDLPIQLNLERTLSHYLERHRATGLHNASAMLLDHRSMEVLASIGSADFFNDAIAGQVDGTRARRSPGSTLKPFVYGLAMDQGLIHPMSMLKDAPSRYGAYTPENFDRGFMGPVMARDALMFSRNVPAIELLADVGHERFHQFLTNAGVGGLKDADYYGLAMILGGNELTMTELVRLYAMLANQGRLRPVKDLREVGNDSASITLLSAESSFLVLDMLRDNPRPDELSLGHATSPVAIAWKTGTSYAYRDAWTVGVLGPYVLAVWVGNFDGTGNPAFVGRQAAAPLFFEMADRLIADLPDQPDPREPSSDLNLRQVAVCASTGDLPGRHCPTTRPSWFIPGVSPITVSTVHRAIRVSNHTGLRTCRYERDNSHDQVFEFWPSDLAVLFRQAGISIRRPPAWEAGCSLDGKAALGVPPRITSPSNRLTYHVRPDRSETETLALTAATDGDVKSLFWFVNDRFVGQVSRDEPALWQPVAGNFDVLVVDDLGRSDSSRLQIEPAR